MSTRQPAVSYSAHRAALVLLAVALIALTSSIARAQNNNNNNNNNGNNGGLYVSGAVGGVSIDPQGMLQNAAVDQQGRLAAIRDVSLDPVPSDMTAKVELRKISLRRLEDQIQQLVQMKHELPESILYLAGLQQIHYVILYPEQNDIVLVGPAEGWKLSPRGAVVGQTTGRPVMLLDDLLVALRATDDPTPSVISCSIDPTPEGLKRLTEFNKSLSGTPDPKQTAAEIERQLGPQTISVNGVPETSHFARVMVAADFRMKRVSMNLDPAPIRGLPGFMEMMRAGGSGVQNMLPRWWLAPDYQPLLRDADGLTWQLRGGSVKTMTETDYLDAAGVRHQGGKADGTSQRWADLMTKKYDELALADPVFGQLRNCMDLAVVAALIAQQGAADKINCDLPTLTSEESLPAMQLNAPKQVASNASLAHKSHKWMIAAGGVSINPWAIIDKAEEDKKLAEVRTKVVDGGSTSWWWD
jgi:hypothetical protein